MNQSTNVDITTTDKLDEALKLYQDHLMNVEFNTRMRAQMVTLKALSDAGFISDLNINDFWNPENVKGATEYLNKLIHKHKPTKINTMKKFQITVERTYTTTVEVELENKSDLLDDNGQFKNTVFADGIVDTICEQEMEQMDTDGLAVTKCLAITDIHNIKTIYFLKQ